MSGFKEFMSFSNKEKNGILIWAFIIILLLFVTKFIPFTNDAEKVDVQSFKNQIDNLIKQTDENKVDDNKFNYVNKKFTPTSFNPNTVSSKEMQTIGFSKEQIQNITNYRNKGGKFYQKEDFKKLYLISDEEYAVLESFIRIDKKKTMPRLKTYPNNVLRPFDFDPNVIDRAGMQQLGLSKKQIDNIENYRNRGAVFYKKEDFKKLYLISDDEFEILEPFIQLKNVDDERFKEYNEKTEVTENEIINVEINNASEEELQNINGIGPSFSKRIVTYRDLLGGYYEKNQLLEVFGIDEEKLSQIENKIDINTASILKIPINSAEFKTVLKHPYFEYEIVKAIFNYRNQNGPFENVEDLQNIEQIDKEIYNKIKHYVDVD